MSKRETDPRVAVPPPPESDADPASERLFPLPEENGAGAAPPSHTAPPGPLDPSSTIEVSASQILPPGAPPKAPPPPEPRQKRRSSTQGVGWYAADLDALDAEPGALAGGRLRLGRVILIAGALGLLVGGGLSLARTWREPEPTASDDDPPPGSPSPTAESAPAAVPEPQGPADAAATAAAVDAAPMRPPADAAAQAVVEPDPPPKIKKKKRVSRSKIKKASKTSKKKATRNKRVRKKRRTRR